MRYYVIINGVNSLTIEGLAIKTLPPISKPAMRNIREEIDGRDGDITTELGYGAYDRILEIGLYGAYDIDKIISFFNSKGTIIFSDEPDKYYNFEIVDRIDYTKLVKFRTAMINIHCQPFKYPVTEEPQVEEFEYVEGTGEAITLDNTEEAILNKIELYGNTSQNNKIIPSDYTQVDYIESNGNQYIDTGLLGGPNRTVKVKLISYDTTDVVIYGARESAGNTAIYLSNRMITNAWQISYGNIFYSQEDTYETNKLVDIEVFMTNGNQYIKKNGETIYTNTVSHTFPTFTKNDYLFTFNNQGSTGNRAKIRLYDCQVLEGTTLLRHFIPCYRNNDNVVGLYDLVGGQFYTNQGSGSFTKGADANIPGPDYPEPIHVVKGNNTINITGRNIYDRENATEDKILTWAGGTLYNSTGSLVSDFIRIEEGKSITIDHQSNVFCYDKEKNFLGNLMSNGQLIKVSTAAYYTVTIPTGKEIYYIRFSSNVNTAGNTNVKIDNIMANYGSTINDYEPYTSQSFPINLGNLEMAAIPGTDYKDVFIKDGDNWYKREVLKNITFDGTQNVNSTTITDVYFISISSYLTGGWCDHFKYVQDDRIVANAQAGGYLGNNQCCFRMGDTKDRIYFKTNQFETGNALKTWLSTNNTKVYYVRANPTDVAITGTLADQLDAIKNAISYRRQTNVSQTNNDAPFILDISALKEGSDHLVINNAGNIYAKPTIDIEGTGVVDIYLNDVQILEADLTEINNIVIDTESMEAYNPDTNALANRQITGDYSKIKLEPGDNDLRFSGDLSKATITDYTRWL